MRLEAIIDLTLHGDNKMSIVLTNNAESQYYTKHINVKHHYIGELVNKKELTIKWISRTKILANRMTKALPTKILKTTEPC